MRTPHQHSLFHFVSPLAAARAGAFFSRAARSWSSLIHRCGHRLEESRPSEGWMKMFAAKSVKENIFSIERGNETNSDIESAKHKLPDSLNPSATILIVDDEEFLLEYVRVVLQRAGYSVLSAQNGGEAWDLIVDRHDIRLLLTDIVMPGSFDGFELAQRVRKHQPELPVLLMTGAALHDYPSTNAPPWQGMMLRKPFYPDQLLTIVRENLEAANRFR